jgi:hypothetical protein
MDLVLLKLTLNHMCYKFVPQIFIVKIVGEALEEVVAADIDLGVEKVVSHVVPDAF